MIDDIDIWGGMRYLDQRFPNWERSVNIVNLDMASPTEGLIPQVVRAMVEPVDGPLELRRMLRDLGAHLWVAFGFDVVLRGAVYDDVAAANRAMQSLYVDLTDLWREAIAMRRLATWRQRQGAA